MSSDTCLSSFGARLFVLALQFPWFPGSLRCVAQNPRILLVNLIQRTLTATLVLPFFQPSVSFSHRDPTYCTLSI